jgi:hypothetical protein
MSHLSTYKSLTESLIQISQCCLVWLWRYERSYVKVQLSCGDLQFLYITRTGELSWWMIGTELQSGSLMESEP